jgi:hypothetical protein
MAERAVATAKASEAKQTCSNSCKQSVGLHSSGSTADRILQLQRTAGNKAVQRLIKSGALQAKLRVGQPDDIYEQEADRVAEQVVRMPESQISNEMKISKTVDNPIQHKCPECKLKKEEKEKLLQKKKILAHFLKSHLIWNRALVPSMGVIILCLSQRVLSSSRG